MYTILGAAGHTGSAIANRLLAAGKQVRVVGRDPKKLTKFSERGAEAVTANVTDVDALRRSFSGAQAAYVILPPDPSHNDYRAFQKQAADAIAVALQEAGVRHAVTLSSVGADKPDKTGPIAGVHYLEKRLGEVSGLNAIHLRVGYFMENTLPQVAAIQTFGMMAGPVDADLKLPMIATRDIGYAAAEALLRLDFKGQHSQELWGPREVSHSEAAEIIGAAIGKPGLSYVRLPDDQMVQTLSSMGMSKNSAELIVEMANALNVGRVKTLEKRSAKNTAPTSFEQFVEEVFVPAYKGRAASAS